MRQTKLQELGSRILPDTSSRIRLGDVFVAALRCRSLRCRAVSVGIRGPSEWIDWRSLKCPKCRRVGLLMQREQLADVEVDGQLEVARWRPRAEAGERENEWRYLPFDLASRRVSR